MTDNGDGTVSVATGGGGGSPGGTGTQIQYKNGSSFGGVPGSSTTATGPIFSSATVPLLGTTAIYNPADSGSYASPTPITLGGNLPYVPSGGCGGHCDIGGPPDVIINPPVVPSAFYVPGLFYPPTLGVTWAGNDPAVTAPAVVLGINVNSNTGMIGLGTGLSFDHQGFYANPSENGTGTDTFWQLPYPDAAGFWKSDGSKNLSIAPLTSSDMAADKSSTNTWTAQQTFTKQVTISTSAAIQSLTAGTSTYASYNSSGTITPDGSMGNNISIVLHSSCTLNIPINAKDFQTFRFRISQDAAGSRTVTLGSGFDVGGTTFTLSTAANKIDYFICIYRAATSKCDLMGNPTLGY